MTLNQAIAETDEKLRLCIDQMQSKLSEGTTPQFREFWEIKKECLALFKENLSPKTRGDLWKRYVDLSAEARRLKGILEEQSIFACEQIDLAIQGLSVDLDSYEERLIQMPDLEVNLDLMPLSLKKNEYYNPTQKQLSFLNALAAKVNALRKEAIKTDMRVRSRSKMLKQLASCGDRVFPLRKELIKKISEEFVLDVSCFVKTYFEADKKTFISIHQLREEVKNLQLLAKQLTLNTQAFTETRIALSFCWDQLKAWDKEKKQERADIRNQQKQSYEEALSKVKEFELFCLSETSLPAVLKQHEETLNFLKGLKDLGSAEFRQLKDLLATYKRPFEEKQKEQQEAVQRHEKELESLRLAKLHEVKEEAQKLLENAESMSAEEAQAQRVSLEETMKSLTLSKAEKMALERFMKLLRDRLLEVKSKRILSLSDSDQAKHDELYSILQEKKVRRQEIKTQLEAYRKAVGGGAGFDFEKAMMYKELMESEKEVLEKISAAIEELEEKIAQIEG